MEQVCRDLKAKKVLDAGAGDKPYVHLFYDCDYESCDHPSLNFHGVSAHTFFCDLKSIPRASECYDLVVCNQVLEHVPEPGLVLKEFYRILKPGGQIILTVPQCHGLHMIPYNYFNFLEFGIAYLCQKNGFRNITIKPLGGIFCVLGKCWDQAFLVLLERFVFPANIRSLVLWVYNLVFFPLRFFWLGLDNFDSQKKWTLNYGVLAEKP